VRKEIVHTASGRAGWFAVEITRHRAVVRVAVADCGAAGEPRVIDNPAAVHGRGLVIVRSLSVRTGVCGDYRGRVVWADVPWSASTRRAAGQATARPALPMLPPRMTAERAAEIRAAYDGGLTARACAAKFWVNQETVARAVRATGGTMRRPGPRCAAGRHTGRVQTPPPRSAEYFDGWYADMARSPVKDEIFQRHLGLPPDLLSTSLLGWAGIAEVTAALRLSPGQTLLDLACGRGGYGLEIAARAGATLVGVDFSAEAIRQARQLAQRLGRAADFRVGDLAATGLDDGSVDAVLCVDAIQFAGQPDAAYGELRRVLAPAGRVALTCWESLDRDDGRVPARVRGVDLGAGLAAAGFSEVEVGERPGWRDCERAMWQEAAALDPGDDPALRSFHDEGVRSLATFGLVRRVLATASAPPAGARTPGSADKPAGPPQSREDTDADWGERAEPDDDERLRRDRPPHWDSL
jgi:SAM-dependent methyltransferase